MKQFVHLAERPEMSFGIRTEYINGKRHYITPQGNNYPSITTVLGEFSKANIQKWRNRVGETEANKITGKASRRGTRLHLICESYIQNDSTFLDGQTPDQIELFKSIETYLQKIDNIHGVELALYSDHFGLAGRTDLIGEYENKLSVIDYKTSSKPKKKEWCEGYFAQGSFYAVAYEELTGIPVTQVVIIMAVEQDAPQIFVEKRDDWIDKIWEAKKLYELNN